MKISLFLALSGSLAFTTGTPTPPFPILPRAAPAPKVFTVGVKVDGLPTYYLENGKNGEGTTNKSRVERCSLSSAGELNCGTGTVSVSSEFIDMTPLRDNLGDVRTGWSVDANRTLHWRNDNFAYSDRIDEFQNGEAQYTLYPYYDSIDEEEPAGYTLYVILGCPRGVGEDMEYHHDLPVGRAMVLPLDDDGESG